MGEVSDLTCNQMRNLDSVAKNGVIRLDADELTAKPNYVTFQESWVRRARAIVNVNGVLPRLIWSRRNRNIYT
jgi:hypothetical protein